MNGRTVLTALGAGQNRLCATEDRRGHAVRSRPWRPADGRVHPGRPIRRLTARAVAARRAQAFVRAGQSGDERHSRQQSALEVFASRLGRDRGLSADPASTAAKSPERPHAQCFVPAAALPAKISAQPIQRDGARSRSVSIHAPHYPPHPVKDGLGHAPAIRLRPARGVSADAAAVRRSRIGRRSSNAVVAAVCGGSGPSVVPVTDNRFARTNIRVVLAAAERGR